MSWAMRKPSRDRPSRKLPAIASRGAKPMLCTKPSNLGQAGQVGKHALDLLVAATSQSKISLESNSAGELGDAVLEALAHVAERQLGALRWQALAMP
jgi:hypothetical protein